MLKSKHKMSPDTSHRSHLQNQNEFRVRRQQVQVYIILNEKFTIKLGVTQVIQVECITIIQSAMIAKVFLCKLRWRMTGSGYKLKFTVCFF